MFAPIFGATFTLVLFFGSGHSTPVVEYEKGLRYEEYTIEHEISTQAAKNASVTAHIESLVTPAGCQACTAEEKRYCLGRDLINDHCCCDKRYHENFPFVPHTCYFGQQLCSPVVGDCAEYSRLRTCCCDRYVLEKWKAKFMGSSSCKHIGGNYFPLILLSQIVYIFVYSIT